MGTGSQHPPTTRGRTLREKAGEMRERERRPGGVVRGRRRDEKGRGRGGKGGRLVRARIELYTPPSSITSSPAPRPGPACRSLCPRVPARGSNFRGGGCVGVRGAPSGPQTLGPRARGQREDTGLDLCHLSRSRLCCLHRRLREQFRLHRARARCTRTASGAQMRRKWSSAKTERGTAPRASGQLMSLARRGRMSRLLCPSRPARRNISLLGRCHARGETGSPFVRIPARAVSGGGCLSPHDISVQLAV